MKRARPLRLLKLLIAAGFAAVLAAGLWLIWLPNVKPLKTRPPKTTAYIELRKRQALKAKRTVVIRWTYVPYSAISEHLIKAVVTAEDDEFWRHDGVDWNAIKAAYERNRKEGKFAAGGSTITMQLARNLYLSPSKNPLRKAKEILIARRLEKDLGKAKILELYLNVAEWGKGIFGCEAAAREYFSKSCAELGPDEAVAMAVVLPNPRRWDPAKRGKYVDRNSARIIGRMAAAGWWPGFADDDEQVVPIDASTDAAGGLEVVLPDPGQRTETDVNVSTGSLDSDQGRNPVADE